MGFQDVVFLLQLPSIDYYLLDYFHLLGSGAANGLSGCSVPASAT